MCHPARCRTCGRTTWRGCGRHIDEVRARVPAGDWCPGHSEPTRRGVLARLLGR